MAFVSHRWVDSLRASRPTGWRDIQFDQPAGRLGTQSPKKINARDEMANTNDERNRARDKLKRLGLAFVDGHYEETQYRQMKQALMSQIESLVIPEIDAAGEAGVLLRNMPELWSRASLM